MVDTIDETVTRLAANRYENSVVLVWGLGYWFSILVKPDLVGNFGTAASVASMAIMGAVILGNLVYDSRLVWVLLGAFMASGIVSSWAMTTQWNVPYSAGLAAVSMTFVNAATAVVSFAKAFSA